MIQHRSNSKRVFKKIMVDSLSGQEARNRRLLIVLDNLDRLDSEDAKSIWSTLQTFLQDRVLSNESWSKRLWILVPYDPTGIHNIWMDNHSDDTKRRLEIGPEWNRIEDSYQRRISQSFVDKSFQIRYHVPPLLRSCWKRYLAELIKKALPDYGPSDRDVVYKVFNVCHEKYGRIPTPRELKLYVNQIGAIHSQWKDQFPLGQIGYFTILRWVKFDLAPALLAGKLPEDGISDLLKTERSQLAANLAGMNFNVSARQGVELLLGDTVVAALTSNNSDKLVEIERTHGLGFWNFMDSYLMEMVGSAEQQSIDLEHWLDNVSRCINASDLLASRSSNSPEVENVRNSLKQLGLQVEFSVEWTEGAASLCNIVRDEAISSASMIQLQQEFSTRQDLDKASIDHLNEFWSVLAELGHVGCLQTPFTCNSARTWIRLYPNIKVLPEEEQLRFRPNIDTRGVIDEMRTMLRNHEIDYEIDDDSITSITEMLARGHQKWKA